MRAGKWAHDFDAASPVSPLPRHTTLHQFEFPNDVVNEVLVAIGNVLAQQRQPLRSRHHLEVPLQMDTVSRLSLHGTF